MSSPQKKRTSPQKSPGPAAKSPPRAAQQHGSGLGDDPMEDEDDQEEVLSEEDSEQEMQTGFDALGSDDSDIASDDERLGDDDDEEEDEDDDEEEEQPNVTGTGESTLRQRKQPQAKTTPVPDTTGSKPDKKPKKKATKGKRADSDDDLSIDDLFDDDAVEVTLKLDINPAELDAEVQAEKAASTRNAQTETKSTATDAKAPVLSPQSKAQKKTNKNKAKKKGTEFDESFMRWSNEFLGDVATSLKIPVSRLLITGVTMMQPKPEHQKPPFLVCRFRIISNDKETPTGPSPSDLALTLMRIMKYKELEADQKQQQGAGTSPDDQQAAHTLFSGKRTKHLDPAFVHAQRTTGAPLLSSSPDQGRPDRGSQRWTLLRRVFMAVVAIAVVWFMLQLRMAEEGFELGGMDLSPPTEDYYAVLGVSRRASDSEIASAYRSLAKRLHPDRNKGCVDCVEKFHAVARAYQVLADPTQRSVYDQLETNYNPLPSDAIELTASNFDALVTSGPETLWIVQVYSDWHRSCIWLSPIWEEAVHTHTVDGSVRFGRIHIKREEELVKRFPVRFGVVPTVLSFINGKLGRSVVFGGGTNRQSAMKILENIIEQDFPNVVHSIEPSQSAVLRFLSGENPASAQDQSRVLIVSERKADASMAVKITADAFQENMVFGQLAVSQAQNPTAFLNGLFTRFGESKSKKFPYILFQRGTIGANAVPVEWVPSSITAGNIRHAIVEHILRRSVPQFHHLGYIRHCVGSDDAVCVLRLEGCVGARTQHGFINAEQYENTTLQIASDRTGKINGDLPAGLQFARVDVQLTRSLEPLCAVVLPEPSVLVAVTDQGRKGVVYAPVTSSPRSTAIEVTQWLHELADRRRHPVKDLPSMPYRRQADILIQLGPLQLSSEQVRHWLSLVALGVCALVAYRWLPNLSPFAIKLGLSLIMLSVFGLEAIRFMSSPSRARAAADD